MSLTYAQKRSIQQEYGVKDAKELATDLGVPISVIEKHIAKNKHLFTQKTPKKVMINSRAEKISYIILLALIVLVVYFNGMFSAFVSDDIYVIVNEEDRFKSLSYFLYQPTVLLRNIQYFLAYQIGGLTPFLFRLPNLFFHMGFVILTYLTMHFFTKRKHLPFMVALLAAVHPMMIESVTWISGGIYAQAAFFAMLSFYLYIRAKHERRIRIYFLSLLSFLAAVSTSEKTIVFPFIILLYEISFGSWKDVWRHIAGYFGISFLWGLVIMQHVNERLSYLQVTNGAASKFQFNNPFVQIPVALTKYFELFTWPDKLTLYQSEYAMNLQQFVVRAFITIIFLIIIGVSYKYKRSLFFWLSFFVITLLTTMNPFGLSWIVAERYSYFGSIGLYFGFVLLLYQLIDRPKLKALGYTIFVVVVIALSVRTIIRNIDWRNEDNLWKATARVSHSDPKTHNNMGDVYARNGDLAGAAKSFETALAINPNYPDATHNLANIYRMQGKYEEAFQLYLRAVELNPNIWQSHLNLAAIYFEKKDYAKSLEHAIKADTINPKDVQIKTNIGTIYTATGEYDKAREYYQGALALDPTNANAQKGLDSLKNLP